MAYDYDKLYGRERDALGPPTSALVEFFDRYGQQNARVLDLGCGQGRDAVFIARLGHRVTGVDISPNGIRDLNAVAKKERLPIEGIVADITTFAPSGTFDIILIDRTLHMLKQEAQLSVLSTLLDHVTANGWLLIVDEPLNIKGFRTAISGHRPHWIVEHQKRGYLFVRHA